MQPAHRNRPPRTAKAIGFTLVEALIAMVVCAVLLTATLPSFQSLIDARRVDGAASQLASDLQFARAEAVARNEPVRLTLIPRQSAHHSLSAPACYVLHTGPRSACHCVNTGPAVCSAPALSIKTVPLEHPGGIRVEANVASVLFDPLHGTASPSGTFHVGSASKHAVQHVVNLMGRVRSCSPGATVSGYRRC